MYTDTKRGNKHKDHGLQHLLGQAVAENTLMQTTVWQGQLLEAGERIFVLQIFPNLSLKRALFRGASGQPWVF